MEDLQYPLCHGVSSESKGHDNQLDSCSTQLDHKDVTRTGGLLVAVSHIITAVIGAGVLSLSWSFAQLGWIAGPLVILFFAFVTIFSSFLMADSYWFFDRVSGPRRNRTYQEAVTTYLGESRALLCALMQHIGFYGAGVTYTITASSSMRFISDFQLNFTNARGNKYSNREVKYCYHKYGHDSPCDFSEYKFMFIYGAMELFLSQIPDFDKTWWVSVVAAIMSFSYSTIGLGLGISKVIENGKLKGSIEGVMSQTTSSIFSKFSLISQAFGDIAFAYPYTALVLEIQDTLISPPAVEKTMKKASIISVVITTFFYMLCAIFGYGSFGQDTPGNILTGFGFYEPYWLVDFANACVAVHLIGAYQIYCQPVFSLGEKLAAKKWPNSSFRNFMWSFNVPMLGSYCFRPYRLLWRTGFVFSTTAIAIVFPYFNTVLAILGVLGFWPLTIYFPVKMYMVRTNVQSWSFTWILLNIFTFFCLFVSILAIVGTIEGII